MQCLWIVLFYFINQVISTLVHVYIVFLYKYNFQYNKSADINKIVKYNVIR